MGGEGTRYKNGMRAEVGGGYDQVSQQYSAQKTMWEDRLRELEDGKREEIAKRMRENGEDWETASNAVAPIFKSQIEDAQEKIGDFGDLWEKAQTNRRRIDSRINASCDPRKYGTSNLDSIASSKRYSYEVYASDGPIRSILDLVARDSGFTKGLQETGLKRQLSDPNQAAMFVQEAMRKARLLGWDTESVNTWVTSLAEYLGSPAPEEVQAMVNAAVDVKNTADFQITQETMALQQQQQQQAGGAGVDGLSLIQSPEFLSTLSPSTQRILGSGSRPVEGSAESAEVGLNILLAGEAAGMSEEELNALKTAYESMPEMESGKGGAVDMVVTSEDKEVLKGGIPRADILASQRSGRDDYVNALVKSLGDKLPTDMLRYAMNPDGVFDKDRSDQAWEQVKDAAMEMSKENLGTDEKPEFMSLEDIQIALNILEKKRGAEDLHPLDDPLRIDPRSYR